MLAQQPVDILSVLHGLSPNTQVVSLSLIFFVFVFIIVQLGTYVAWTLHVVDQQLYHMNSWDH